MIEVTQDIGCAIGKKDCSKIGIQNPNIIEDQGTFPVVVGAWFDNDNNATGVFLGKNIIQTTNNVGNEFDGTTQGFEDLINRCFPELFPVDITVILDGNIKLVVINFPELKEYDCWEFSAGASSPGTMGFNATNGVLQTIKDCYYQIRLYDEDNNDLGCELPQQKAKFTDTIPVETIDTCFSNWNVQQSTTLPPVRNTNVLIDPSFCTRFFYRIWEWCSDTNAKCGYSVSDVVNTELQTVTNSVYDNDYDYSQHCILEQFNNGLATFPTQLKCIEICRDTETHLWICPDITVLDDLGVNYSYSFTKTQYDINNNQISSSDTIVGTTNEAYTIPTNLNTLPNACYFTIEFNIRINNGALIKVTQPVSYQVKKNCCSDLTLYFKERLGGLQPICIECVEAETINTKGVKTCVLIDGKSSVFDSSNESYKSIKIKSYSRNENLLEVFSKATDHYIINDNGEYESVSIKSKKIDYKVKGDLAKIELTIEFKNCII